jgi:chromosome segregation ATPase
MQISSLLLLSLLLSMPAFAKDVTMEQASVTAAREDFDNAKTAYDDVNFAINTQENHIKEALARLKELQIEQTAAKARLANTKITLEKKQKILDQAWNNSK